MTKFRFVFESDEGIGSRVYNLVTKADGWLIRWKVQNKQAYIIWDDERPYDTYQCNEKCDAAVGTVIELDLCELDLDVK